MKILLLAAMLVAVLILGALSGALFGAKSPRFVLVSGNDGTIWRMDNRTGEVSVCGSALNGRGLAQAESQLSAHIRASGGNPRTAPSAEVGELDALSRPRCSPWSPP